jgi:hypothetical protein
MFELHLHTCNLGTKTRKGVNPFTGEPLVIHIDLGLTAAEREAVQTLLVEVGASDPDPDYYRRVVLPKGSIVNAAIGPSVNDLKLPCIAFAVEYYSLTTEVASFIHALASKGNMSIGSASDPAVVALTLPEQKKRVVQRWPKASVVASPRQLEAWLRQNIR